MEEKKNYIKPCFELINVELDVIVTSGGSESGGDTPADKEQPNSVPNTEEIVNHSNPVASVWESPQELK